MGAAEQVNNTIQEAFLSLCLPDKPLRVGLFSVYLLYTGLDSTIWMQVRWFLLMIVQGPFPMSALKLKWSYICHSEATSQVTSSVKFFDI